MDTTWFSHKIWNDSVIQS